MPFLLGLGNEFDCVFEGLYASHRDVPRYFTEEDKKQEVSLIGLLPYLKYIYSHIFYAITSIVTGGKLWWADEESAQLGTVTKRDGRNPVILRNKTSGVVHMKVYDREAQKGKAHTYQHSENATEADHIHLRYLIARLLLVVLNIQEETRAR